ncbi:sodium/proline symporter [Phormidium sp. CCY1219]|uniref:sodium/proline symporter n=1 Tax=Phormidium sp. CCY1219 TaxID=2886104 RepID=UPI002D1E6638|nr:sodium/proline symporter [Phormidium sp. CCY1219]MEB3830871.1 sodium/proline symporter [Phormidium sp. CCY1219]
MLDRIWIAISFIVFLLLFTGVGIYSATRKTNTTADYLLASRTVNFWLTALSAFATAHSGAMFTAIIGYTYQVGISAAWLPIGWVLGDALAWIFVYKRLRVASEESACETVGGFLAGDQKGNRAIAIISAFVTLAFLGTYSAAQLVAGSKALHVLFGWDYSWGIILGAAIVVAYCFSGGIRASIWTDAAQSGVMMFAMMGLLVLSIAACGGVGELWSQLESIDPLLVNPSPSNLEFGTLFFVLGWVASGLAVLGQPHILVRAMAIDSAENIGLSRNLYLISYTLFSAAAIGVGLTARVLMPQLMVAGRDPELALPLLSVELLPAVLVGVILAGLFAAVISTTDSQILSCSAALTQDLFPKAAHSYKMAKIGTVTATAVILAIALAGNQNVFMLALLGWSTLGSTFGPLLLVRVFRLPLNPIVAIAMMVVAIATTLIWRFGLNWSNNVIETLPAMIAPTLVYAIYWVFAVRQNQQNPGSPP